MGFFFLSSLSPGQKIMTILFRKPSTCSLEQILTWYFTWKNLKAIAISGEHRAEFSPSEVSWMPDNPPSCPEKETFRTHSSACSTAPNCVRQRSFSQSQIAGASKAEKVPLHTATTFLSVPDKCKHHTPVLLDTSTMKSICRNACCSNPKTACCLKSKAPHIKPSIHNKAFSNIYFI